MNLLIISPTMMLFGIPGLLAFGCLFYIIFNNRDETNKSISLLPQIAIYLFSLVPLGILIGSYIKYRKKMTPLGKQYKFNKKANSNATNIIIISSFSAVFSLINLT
tara:strand:- start:143 stop:460 length:318 start_codon:yes stop_codon:yes gene_type:complete